MNQKSMSGFLAVLLFLMIPAQLVSDNPDQQPLKTLTDYRTAQWIPYNRLTPVQTMSLSGQPGSSEMSARISGPAGHYFSVPSLPKDGAGPSYDKDQSYKPRIEFWTVGNKEGYIKRFGANSREKLVELRKMKAQRDCVLLALAQQPLTEKAIAETCSIPLSRLQHLLNVLQSLNRLKKYNGNQWATTVPVVTDKQMIRIRKSLIPLARKVALYLEEKVPRIKHAYEKGKLATDPSWEKAAHLIIDKLIIDATFHGAIGALERQQGMKKYYSRDQRQLPAFYLELGPNFSNFGVNWYAFKKGDIKREVYILHGKLFNRFDIPFERYRGDQKMSALLHRVSLDGGLQNLTEDEIRILEDMGWVVANKLAPPIINADSIKAFKADLETIGREGAEVMFTNYSIILDSFKNSPYAGFMNGGGDYIQVCYHVLFSLIIEELIHVGALPAIPTPVPAHLGVYITVGSVY